MRLLINFARRYPWRSTIMLLALLLAGLVEGVGLSALLPLLSLAADGPGAPEQSSGIGGLVKETLLALGLNPGIGVLLLVIVGGITLKSALVLLAQKQVGYTVAHVATDLRLELMRALLATRWEYYLRQPIGGLANAVATEAMRASDAYLYGATMATLLIQALVYAAVALLVSWQATLAALTAGLVFLLLLSRLVRMSRRAGQRQTQLSKSLLARLTDSLQSVKPLKAMARENLADKLLEAETRQLNEALQRQVFSKEALSAFQEPMLTLLVAVGLYLALTHWGLPLTTVMVMVFLLARVLLHLGKVQRQYQRMTSCESAYWSLQETIREAQAQREAAGGGLAPQLQRAIRLERVGFAYRDKWVLRELSLTIPAGAFTALIGASGAGKTTIADLVTGLLQPQQGEVLIDDLPLGHIDLKRWRRMIGYAPQETILLHDTVLHNVTLGDAELDAADAEYALRAAGAWEFVAALPQGLHTVVGERGSRLSGGQRQRIVIARALVHRPKLLILDEATSALDPASEADICTTLRALRGQLTILAISHQPALVEAADRVYRLRDGVAITEIRATHAAPSGA